MTRERLAEIRERHDYADTEAAGPLSVVTHNDRAELLAEVDRLRAALEEGGYAPMPDEPGVWALVYRQKPVIGRGDEK